MMTVSAETEIDQAIESFRAGVAAAAGDGLAPRGWSAEDWRELFRFTSFRRVSVADTLIRRGDPDRTLYFILRGSGNASSSEVPTCTDIYFQALLYR